VSRTRELPVVDAVVQNFLNALAREGRRSPHGRLAIDARAVFVQLQQPPPSVLLADIEDLVVAAGPTGAIPIRVVRPPGDQGSFPVILYLHGGCWVAGDADSYDRLVREFANGVRAAVVFVGYTLAPEAHYPVQIEQAYAVLEHIAQEADALLNDLPEALVMVAECDVTRDDAEEYARRMTQAGVIVTCIRYNSVIHDFLSLNVLCEASVVRSATAQAIEALHNALYGS